MKITKYDDREEWMEARKTKITGSSVKDLIIKRGSAKKMGFYELIAERLVVAEDGLESPMDRGNRLESIAVDIFTEDTGKGVITDLVIWTRDENERIAISPDGYMEDLKEAVEVKCLASANHIKTYLTKEVPSEYEDQVIQYFVVNSDLETLYFVLYDPRVSVKPYFYLTINRADIAPKIEKYLADETLALKEIDAIIEELTKI
jgi:putative phage-type endonuclease